jgi:signal peptidase
VWYEAADQQDVETSGRRAVTGFSLKVLLSAVVLAATATMFSLFTWTILPLAAGWSPSVVVTGSMEPSIAPGDIVVTAPIKTSALKVGYVIRFKDPSHTHPYLLHRIAEIRDDGNLITKGDANRSKDSTPVPPENVTGVARLRVPMIGLPAVWLRNRQFLQLGLTLAAVALAARVLTGLGGLVASGQDLGMIGTGPDPTGPDPTDADQPVDTPPGGTPEAVSATATRLVDAAPVGALAAAGPTPAAQTLAVTMPAVTTPAVTTPAVTTPAVTTPAVTTPAVTTTMTGVAPASWPTEAAGTEAGGTEAGGTDAGGTDAITGRDERSASGGRHRGEGRATWRRDRSVERPSSRRDSRHNRARANSD